MDTDLYPQTIKKKKKPDVADVKFSLIFQAKWHPSSNKGPGDPAIACSLTSLTDLPLNHNILLKIVLDQSFVLAFPVSRNISAPGSQYNSLLSGILVSVQI